MSLSQQIPVNDLDPFADDFLADPYAHDESLRQAGPVLRLGRYDLWAMARYEQVFTALRDHDTYFRTTTIDVDLDAGAGARIPAGEKVLLFLGAANRDPARWGEDADAFDIRHRSAGHVAFGLGIHGCVGQAVARLEAEALLTALARRVRTIEPAGEPTIKLNNTMHGFTALPVRVTPLP